MSRSLQPVRQVRKPKYPLGWTTPILAALENRVQGRGKGYWLIALRKEERAFYRAA